MQTVWFHRLMWQEKGKETAFRSTLCLCLDTQLFRGYCHEDVNAV